MASSPSPASSAGSSGSLYNRHPTLEDLVNHFVASKRSLSSTTTLWRANEIANSARLLLEENAILSAKNSFIRCSIEEQIDALEAVRRGIGLVEAEVKTEFKNLLHSLDTSFSGLQTTLTILRDTPIESVFQPPNTPQKHLYDFIDSATVTNLKESLRSCIDRYNDAINTLHDSTDAFDESLQSLHNAATNLPASPATNSSPTLLPSLFRDLEIHATEAATCFQSLVRHYDLCVTALKHTEGGGEAASRATDDMPSAEGGEGAGVDLSLQQSAFAAPPEPLTEAERINMLAVLQKDAVEVDDVVNEIRERGAEMEFLLTSMSSHISLLRTERSALLSALSAIENIGKDTRAYMSAARDFVVAWDAERAKITEGIEEWKSLRDFYERFNEAYANLLVEVGERRRRHEKAKQKARESEKELEELYQEDLQAREAFTLAQGDFLPLDIWPNLRDPPRRYEIVPIDKEASGSIPDVKREVLERAMQRLRGRM